VAAAGGGPLALHAELRHGVAHILDGWRLPRVRLSMAEDAVPVLPETVAAQGLVSLSVGRRCGRRPARDRRPGRNRGGALTPAASPRHRLQAPAAAWRLAWAAPCSLIGLLGALPLLLAGGRACRVGPTLEIALPNRFGQRAARLPFAAITFGHVILGASHAELARLRRHERVHVRQYERWGALFLLAYPLASLMAGLRTGAPYCDNAFEVQARRLSAEDSGA
jgi:hypothetical protein